MTATEYVILVNEQDEEIGHAEKLNAHQQNLLHRAFSIFIFRHMPQVELLLQQRALTKYHSEGLWTNTCCSHPRVNETLIAAGKRRLKEELGLETELKNVGWFHYNAEFENGLFENEIDHVLVGDVSQDVKIQCNPTEVHAYRWITLANLSRELKETPEKFTPWLKRALEVAFSHLRLG